MRLRRNSNESPIAGVPGDRPGGAVPATGPGSKGPLAAPDRNAIRSVGVAILPGVPLPEWARPPGSWDPTQQAAPYADPRSFAAVPASPVVPGVDPALAALAPASSPLPPPDPAQWSERPAGPVVWGALPPQRQPSTPQQAPAFPPPQQAPAAAAQQATGEPWFTPESMPPPATSSAGQYGWLVQPDVPVGEAPMTPAPGSMAPPAGPAMAPPPGSPMAPPAGPAVTEPTAPAGSPGGPVRSSFIGIPEQAGPSDGSPVFAEPTPADHERPIPTMGPTSTTAPIAWVRADAPASSQPSATVPAGSPVDPPLSPLTPAVPVLEPAGVAPQPAAPAGGLAPAPSAMATGAAWVLADPVDQAARTPAPAQPMPQPMGAAWSPMAMPVPTGRPVPLPPPDLPARPAGAIPGAGSNGGLVPPGPGYITPPAGAWTPPVGPAAHPNGPDAPAPQTAAADAAPEPSGRAAKVVLGVLVGVLMLALAGVLLFVTPGFLRSQEAPAGPPVLQTPATLAGLTKSEPVPGGTAVMTRIAEATGATATSQIATYTADGTIVTVWVANAAGGSPALTATEFHNARGAPLEPLRNVPPGPRGGEMACAAATPARTLCFWNADGVRGAADIRGMGRTEAAQLTARMRVGLEQPAA